MGVHRLNHAVLYVSDVAASATFCGDTLGELQRLARVLREHGALVGASDHGTTKSLYAKDPDGIEFEVVWIIPAHLLTADDLAGRTSVGPLDLPAEIDRFGADELGGVGISIAIHPNHESDVTT